MRILRVEIDEGTAGHKSTISSDGSYGWFDVVLASDVRELAMKALPYVMDSFSGAMTDPDTMSLIKELEALCSAHNTRRV